MTTRAIDFDVYDSAGAPLSGLVGTLAWSFYKDAAGADVTPQPAFSEIGATGRYSCTLDIAEGGAVRGRIDCGASALSRYIDIPLTTERDLRDVPSATELDTALSASHGAGAWGGAAGDGSEQVTLSAEVGAQPKKDVRLDVYSGADVVAQETTDSLGQAVVRLDPGTYTLRGTLAGYEFTEEEIVVSAGGAVVPSTITGTALTASTEGTAPTGLSGTLAWGELVDDGEIEGVVTGDPLTITRTITGAPADITKVWLTFKRKADRAGDDADALLQVLGSITDGVVTFTVAAGETDGFGEKPVPYDVQLLAGSVKTLEVGEATFVQGVTTATA